MGGICGFRGSREIRGVCFGDSGNKTGPFLSFYGKGRCRFQELCWIRGHFLGHFCRVSNEFSCTYLWMRGYFWRKNSSGVDYLLQRLFTIKTDTFYQTLKQYNTITYQLCIYEEWGTVPQLPLLTLSLNFKFLLFLRWKLVSPYCLNVLFFSEKHQILFHVY